MRYIDISQEICVNNVCVFRESTYDGEFSHLMRGMEGLISNDSLPRIDFLKPIQLQSITRLEARLPAFKGLATSLQSHKVSLGLFKLDAWIAQRGFP